MFDEHQLYVSEGGESRRYPCDLDFMLKWQGPEGERYPLVVRDEEEADYWNGLRFITGHQLDICTVLDDVTHLLSDKVYFTFPLEESVKNGSNTRYRKFKS